LSSTVLDKDRSIRLFKYLKELSLLKSPLIRDINNYSDVLWFNEIPTEPECISPLNFEVKGEKWLEVKKPFIPPVPGLPNEIIDWLDESTDLENIKQIPRLVERIKNPNFYESPVDETVEDNHLYEFLYLIDCPDIGGLFENYLNAQWIPWKEEYQRVEKIQKVYSKLFKIYRQQKNLGEEFELIVGMGLLNWKTPNNQIVHRHLLTIPCALQFDSDNGVISITSSSESLKADIEQDMLEVTDRLDTVAIKPLQTSLDELFSRFWDKEVQDTILRSYVQSLSAGGHYWEDEILEIRDTRKEPSVFYSPALILRKRSVKGFQQACTNIIGSIEEDKISIPQGVLRIFNDIDDLHSNPLEKNIGQFETVQSYFPLEANEEQNNIIKSLESRNGVIVQGPPGTGKSHTIANLTSHLLATGKRVLITSQTSRALNVLKEKIPKDLKPLCVSMLGTDSDSFMDLENVVNNISINKDSWNEEINKAQIDELTDTLNRLKERESNLLQTLRAIREKEIYKHQIIGEYVGTAQKITQLLQDNRKSFYWLNDSISLDAQLPLTNDTAMELLNLLEELNSDIIAEIQYSFPPLDQLWEPDEFKKNNQLENQIKGVFSLYSDISLNDIQQYQELTFSKRQKLVDLIKSITPILEQINTQNQPWLFNALQDLLNSKFSTWLEFFKNVEESLKSIKDNANKYNLNEITGLPSSPLAQVHAEATELRLHLESGKGLGIPLLRPKAVKSAWYIIQHIRVDGHKCDKLQTIKVLEDILKIDITTTKITKLMESQLGISMEKNSAPALNLTKMFEVLEPFQLLLKVKSIHEELNRDYCNFSFFKDFEYTIDQLLIRTKQLEFLNITEDFKEIEYKYKDLLNRINDDINQENVHPIVKTLIDSIEYRNEDTYTNSNHAIKNLDVLTKKNIRCEELMHEIKGVLPNLYNQLLTTRNYGEWIDRFKNLKKAFDWAKVNTWYQSFSSTNDKEVSKELNEVGESIKRTISKLASERAWFSTLSKMTEIHRKHLLAWKTANRKAGKRTGINAPMHLRDAQFHMSYCREAIPVWIMPLLNIFETFEMKSGLFDVVIIDEASQSGPEAAILQYLATKIIVVGDDKQISPEYVSIKKEDVNFLRKQYLYDFALADLLDLDSSFFDLANVLFGGRITLREHFRCMPEIIQFSNMISYSHTPLIPLRQYPPKRLEPVVSTHVPNGYREGTGQNVINLPESKAIVETIKNCIKNSDYKNKSMGVISLQNKGQAQFIESLLIKEIGTEQIEKRNIICGDSYDFQGDERDIIFISLVAAPGETGMKAITTEKDKRRFNVAVSRAKDQLWLFHTPTINDFRNKTCLRYQLINYCQNPSREILESNRALCESNFERAVFDQITHKGYRVIPQHQVAGYRIDLVVEGEEGKIAVECDGDYWHGPDRYEHDMIRQRILERCGWNFWKIRGSEYYYDPENALISLWDKLEYHSIEPYLADKKLVKKSTIQIPEINSTSPYPHEIQEKSKTNALNSIPIDNQTIPDAEKADITIIKVPRKPSLEKKKKEKSDRTNVQFKQMDFFTEELDGFHKQVSLYDDELLPSYASKTIQNARKETMDKSNSNGLKEYLQKSGYEVIDKRKKGGALWLIGGEELEPFIEKITSSGKIIFNFAKKGSRSTKHKPSWFTKTNK
jgi:very-short-patch-repair endonuclease